MTQEATSITPTQPIRTDLPPGFIPFDRPPAPQEELDLAALAAEANRVLSPTEPVHSPEKHEKHLDIGVAESAPRGDVLVYRDDANQFYAIIRGKGQNGLDKRAAEHAKSTLAAYLAKNADPDAGSDYALELMTTALESIDDAIDSIDEGLEGTAENGKPTNGKELNYEISAMQIIKDEDGTQRAVYGMKGKNLIIQHEYQDEKPVLLSHVPDKPEHATAYYNGNKPRLVDMTGPLQPNTRFVLATESIPENVALTGHSEEDFFGALMRPHRQTAADELLALSTSADTAEDGRVALVIDTAQENETETKITAPTTTPSPATSVPTPSYNNTPKGREALKAQDRDRKTQVRTMGRNLANLLRLSPVLLTNKLGDYAHKTNEWYKDPERGTRRKIATIAGGLAVGAVVGFLDARSGGAASHHVHAAHQHKPTLYAPKVATTTLPKATHAPLSSPQKVEVAPATTTAPSPATSVPTPSYNNTPNTIPLTSGSNPWDVARTSLQNSGNLAPTNAQILAQDNLILAANHLTAQQATQLPVGFVLRVPPVN